MADSRPSTLVPPNSNSNEKLQSEPRSSTTAPPIDPAVPHGAPRSRRSFFGHRKSAILADALIDEKSTPPEDSSNKPTDLPPVSMTEMFRSVHLYFPE